MFRKLVCLVPKESCKLLLRQRHKMPNSPLIPDYSHVDKVTICGASSPLGQYLAFILKKMDIIKEVALFDEGNVRGIALDLQHIGAKTRIKPYSGAYALNHALKHSDIVVIANGCEQSLATEDEAISANASVVYRYAVRIAGTCPEALVCIITPPVNIMVPMFSEVLRACCVYDPNKIFGVCSLMEMRANSILADYLSIDPAAVKVPIVGGVSYYTSVPLLSHAVPYCNFSDSELECLMTIIRNIPAECQKMNTAAPLSTAYAVSRFILTLAAGLCSCNCAVQTAFVRSNVLPQVAYFASRIRTSIHGAVENYGLPKIHEYELLILSEALTALEKDLEKAYGVFIEQQREARKEEIEEMCRTNKPFIIRTPCPPCPPCLPTDVCQEKLPDNPCAPANPQNLPCVC